MTKLRLAAVIVAVQLLIPATLLVTRGGDARPRAFGWQMYSAHGDRYAAWLVEHGGTETPVDVDDLLLRPRTELQLDTALVSYLCERNPSTAAVRVQYGPDSTTTECR